MQTATKRVDSLDWLRGLMALSIMLYHLAHWLFSTPGSDSVLGRLGVYGVSVFFVLSGLSMTIVYNSYIKNLSTAMNFYIRRIFRIWPLLWLVVLLTLVVRQGDAVPVSYSFQTIFLNFTTLFGFINPTNYIPTGAWSIGNEMVYYALTPFIFALYNKSRKAGNIGLFVTFGMGIYFAFFGLVSTRYISSQWSSYVNPFNNLFLYYAGIALYYNFNNIKINQWVNLGILLTCVFLFTFLPYHGNGIVLVTRWPRIIFSVLSILAVFSVYKIDFTVPRFIEYPLSKLGVATYAVYLLHPVIPYFLGICISSYIAWNPILKAAVVAFTTIGLSILSYYLFEVRMIRLGKKLSNNTTYFFEPNLKK
jgi:exopolysaccharide production protein ExoZ